MSAELSTIPLDALHRRLGARMAPFAGYDMPLHYKAGILTEHLHTRNAASLFDVSHMGQAILAGAGAARLLETLTPADLVDLAPEGMRYTQLLNDDGGIVDDLMVARLPGRDERMMLIVNAGTKDKDFAFISERLPTLTLNRLTQRALLALQGPRAAQALDDLCPGVGDMSFMDWRAFEHGGVSVFVSRSGYTGEDGFEISIPIAAAEAFALRLLAQTDVAPAGLGARDSLRLEAGLCLYGHDIDETTEPVEASLGWSIGKRRRETGGFPGFGRIRAALDGGPSRRRVGLLPQSKAPVREGGLLFAGDREIGRITSGGFAPSLGVPVAMGYVEKDFCQIGARLVTQLRGKDIEMHVAPLPFVPHHYVKRKDRK